MHNKGYKVDFLLKVQKCEKLISISCES